MGNSLSPFFTDEFVCNQLRLHFEGDEMWDTNFLSFFNQIVERETDFYLKFRGRSFSIDKAIGIVVEVK